MAGSAILKALGRAARKRRVKGRERKQLEHALRHYREQLNRTDITAEERLLLEQSIKSTESLLR